MGNDRGRRSSLLFLLLRLRSESALDGIMMACQDFFERLAQVPQNVPAIRDLNGFGRSRGGSIGEDTGTVAGDQFDAGIRLGLSAGVRRCAPRASFLVSLFTAYHRFTPIFVGVAVQIAVQPQAPGTPSCLCLVRPRIAVVINIVLDHPPDVPLSQAHLLFFLACPFPFEPPLHPKARAKVRGLAFKGDLIDRLLLFVSRFFVLFERCSQLGKLAQRFVPPLPTGLGSRLLPLLTFLLAEARQSEPALCALLSFLLRLLLHRTPHRVMLKRLPVLLSEDTYRHPSLAFCCP